MHAALTRSREARRPPLRRSKLSRMWEQGEASKQAKQQSKHSQRDVSKGVSENPPQQKKQKGTENMKYIQACLVLMCSPLLCFTDMHFLQTGDSRQPCIEQVYGQHVSESVGSLPISVSRFCNSCKLSSFFIIIICITVNCSLWSLILLLQKWLQFVEGSDDG